MAVRLARLVREGTKVNWLVTGPAKIQVLGVHMPHLNDGGEGLGWKGWKEYAAVLDQCAAKLKKKLHYDLRRRTELTKRQGYLP